MGKGFPSPEMLKGDTVKGEDVPGAAKGRDIGIKHADLPPPTYPPSPVCLLISSFFNFKLT
jgi:hypothetical protein